MARPSREGHALNPLMVVYESWVVKHQVSPDALLELQLISRLQFPLEKKVALEAGLYNN